MNSTLETTIMQYAIGGLMALVPAIVWGYIFYKKSPENRRVVVVSFMAGVFSVLPMFIWQYNWNFTIDFLWVHIPNINIYQFIRVLSSSPTWENVLTFTGITIIISLIIYIASAVFTFVSDIIFGVPIREAGKNVIKRTLEEPLIFISTGILTAACIVILSGILPWFVHDSVIFKVIYASFWASMMIGFLEEYSKHLVVRFASDNAIYSINSAIGYSIIVALGFASLENVIYFIDRLWLSPCNAVEIANNLCLFDPSTGNYTHQVGVMLIPFIFRSLLSTLAHVIFSGIFGYFYGVAHFASYELQEIEKKKKSMAAWSVFQKFFRMKASFAFHEVKMLQGLIFSMVVHGIFDFVLDQNLTYLTVPMMFGGYLYLAYLLEKKKNQKKLRLISDKRTSSENLKNTMGSIELLEKFEESYLRNKKKAEDPLSTVEQNIALLEKYDSLVSQKKSKNEDHTDTNL